MSASQEHRGGHHPHSTRDARTPNALLHTASPYLLQHAYNPVAWRPWNPEALGLARHADKPIFLSIGYSTCHWCHVMERESFEDAQTAAFLNEHFIPIKLDREERPDLDDIYMAATVITSGHGGWPMSVFLEPDTLRPFYCGTYFPAKHPMGGRPTFMQVLVGMERVYREQRAEVRTRAGAIAEEVRAQVSGAAAIAPLDARTVEEAVARVLSMYDRVHGGFGVAPKFPQCVFLELLLDARGVVESGTRAGIDAAVRGTLDAMAAGGIHDQLGGGFHRYCVDAGWTVPHFEKMLSDQAQMLSVYTRAAAVYEDAWYGRVARGIVAYLSREMTDALGGFFTAQDADTDGREGGTYLWTPERANAALADVADVADVGDVGDVGDMACMGDAAFAAGIFGLGREPNFTDPHSPHDAPAWILRLAGRPETLAAGLGLEGEDFAERLDRVRSAMLVARATRRQPETDRKVLASWNGMVITALAQTPGGAASARRLCERVLGRLRDGSGGLLRCAYGAVAHTPAMLEDYAWMVRAACACGMMEEARGLLRRVVEVFQDTEQRWSDAAKQSCDLFVRGCTTHDGAMPSGFATLVHALLDVFDATGDEAFLLMAARSLRGQSGRIAQSPAGCAQSVRALMRIVTTMGGHARSNASRREAAELLGQGSGVAAVRPALHSGPRDVVRVFASVDRVLIPAEEPAAVQLRVEIAPGFYVHAASRACGDGTGTQGDRAGLVPFRVDIAHGSGIAAFAEYPRGDAPRADEHMGDGTQGTQRVTSEVYRGSFDLMVVLERAGAWRGTPILTVSWQACGAGSCLAPTVVELDIALDRA